VSWIELLSSLSVCTPAETSCSFMVTTNPQSTIPQIGDRQKEGCSSPNAYVFGNTGVHKVKAICAAPVSNSICSRRGATGVHRIAFTGLTVDSCQPASVNIRISNANDLHRRGDIVIVCDFDHAAIAQLTNYNIAAGSR
jgi:hypothetical protein